MGSRPRQAPGTFSYTLSDGDRLEIAIGDGAKLLDGLAAGEGGEWFVGALARVQVMPQQALDDGGDRVEGQRVEQAAADALLGPPAPADAKVIALDHLL